MPLNPKEGLPGISSHPRKGSRKRAISHVTKRQNCGRTMSRSSCPWLPKSLGRLIPFDFGGVNNDHVDPSNEFQVCTWDAPCWHYNTSPFPSQTCKKWNLFPHPLNYFLAFFSKGDRPGTPSFVFGSTTPTLAALPIPFGNFLEQEGMVLEFP
jgi:hypothetical protein